MRAGDETVNLLGRAFRSRARWVVATSVSTLLLVLCGCGGSQQPASSSGDKATANEAISWTHFDVPQAPADLAVLASQGSQLFAENCASCHGQKGDAKGVCSPFLVPQPRDFTSGIYRFKTTPDGEMPTDEDLFRTVSLGLHSTGMPPWLYLLSDTERWALVAHLKTLTDGFDSQQALESVDLGDEPTTTTAEMIEAGRKVFVAGQCGKCHGETGYGDGPSALTLVDSFDNPITPRNFHNAAQFKRGHTLRDIALTVHTGNNGTPMPAYGEAFKPDEIWALAAYIQDMAEKRFAGGGTQAAATKGDHLGKPDVVIQLTERQWKFIPNELRVRQGQLVRIEFQPTDNGLGVGHGFAIDGYDKSTFMNGVMVQRPKAVTFRADKAGTFTFYCATQCSTGSLHPQMNGKFIVEPANKEEL